MDDFDYDEWESLQPPARTPDPKFIACRNELTAFFKRKVTPYYYTQLEVLFEKQYFHWITYRALKSLVSDGYLREYPVLTKYGSPISFVVRTASATPATHHTLQAHIRSRTRKIEAFSAPDFTKVLGKHLQYLVKAELRANAFQVVAEDTNEFQGKRWTATGHELDFIATHPRGFSVGVEVKNTLPYIPRDEFEIKLCMCFCFGIKPVFAVRWMPKSYIHEAAQLGGFGWLFEYQAYPLGYEDMATRAKTTFGLPAKVMPELARDAQSRFSKWVNKQTMASTTVSP